VKDDLRPKLYSIGELDSRFADLFKKAWRSVDLPEPLSPTKTAVLVICFTNLSTYSYLIHGQSTLECNSSRYWFVLVLDFVR